MELIASASPPNRWSRWLWVGAALAATVFLMIWFRPVEWRSVRSHLAGADARWVAVALIGNLLILVSWAALWRQFLPRSARIGWPRMGGIVALSAAGMNTFPFMAGHALGLGLLAKRGRVGMEVAATVMTLDQLCEGLCKVLLLLAAMVLAPAPEWMQRALLIISVAMAMLLAVLVWLSRPGAAPGWFARWAAHLEVLRHPGRWSGGLLLSLGTKVAEGLAIFAVQRALGVDLPLASVVVVLAAVSVGTMVSVSPGNLGVYEAAVVAGYALFGVPLAQAVALALVQHACFLTAMIGPGYAFTAWQGMSSGAKS
jgi:glycosyltransferase 2 family protein